MYQPTMFWRRGRDSNPCGVAPKRFSRPPRYDRFDTSPYMNCQKADFIGYSIVLEILLEMHFCAAFGVPKKSGVARLFPIFASTSLANFQDRLVMTTSISLRKGIQFQSLGKILEKTLERMMRRRRKILKVKEIQGFFEVCFRYDKKFSRPPRYDHLDTLLYMSVLQDNPAVFILSYVSGFVKWLF